MSVCILCPGRKCGVDREIMRGYCQSRRENAHCAREAPLTGRSRPSAVRAAVATIFFTGLLAALPRFAQNSEISGESLHGKDFTVEEFIETIKKLEAMGAHNINLVTPTHFASQIAEARAL